MTDHLRTLAQQVLASSTYQFRLTDGHKYANITINEDLVALIPDKEEFIMAEFILFLEAMHELDGIPVDTAALYIEPSDV